jgi:NTE family protein
MPAKIFLQWVGAAAVLLLTACATPFDNAPLNKPITPEFVSWTNQPRDIVGTNVVAMSLSGGGMRAAAFSFGVLQALAGAQGDVDVFDDLTFITSVSGGSLTAAYFGLYGRAGLTRYRNQVLEHNFERDLRMSLYSPVNLARLFAGGLNDRSNLARTLDQEIFNGATFADLYKARKPDVWINASNLYDRVSFPFTPPVFLALCSDLSTFPLAEAVAASMAVPLVFSPVVLNTFAEQCLTPLPPWAQARVAGQAEQGVVPAVAQAVRRFRDPTQMRYVKLLDGGLTDNYGLSTILTARAVQNTPYAPLNEADAIRMNRMLFLIVDAGRPPAGDWTMQQNGPSGVDIGLAAADTAIDAAARLGADAFQRMMRDWETSVIQFRCAQPLERVRRYLPAHQQWRCEDVQFFVGVIGFDALDEARAKQLRNMPTRLALSKEEIELAVSAGYEATRNHPAFKTYVQMRVLP